MRVLASVLVGATAASAAKVADNAGAYAARTVAEERTEAITECVTAIKNVLNLNTSTNKDVAALKPTAATVASATQLTSGVAPTTNLLGVYAGLCPDTDSVTAHNAPNDAAQVGCAGCQGANSGCSGKSLEGGTDGAAGIDVIFGGTTHTTASSASGGDLNIYHLFGATNQVADGYAQFGGQNTATGGVAYCVDANTNSACVDTELDDVILVHNAQKTKKVTAAAAQTIYSMMHGACTTAFKQERTLTGSATAEAAGTPFAGVLATADNTLKQKELDVARKLGFLHVGILYNQLMNVLIAADTTISTYKMVTWPATGNMLAYKSDTQGTTVLGPGDIKDHLCAEAAMSIWKANGASAQLTATGGAKAGTAVKATTLYQCISATPGSDTDPCTADNNKDLLPSSAQGWKHYDRSGTTTTNTGANWGSWDGTASSFADNQWLVPLHQGLAGNAMFTVEYPTFTVPALTGVDSFRCKSIKKAVAASGFDAKVEHRCQLPASAGDIPAGLKKLSPLIATNQYFEVVGGTSSTFKDLTIDADISGTGTAGTGNTEVAAMVADLKAGTKIRIITTEPRHWHYKKKADLNPGDADTCGVVRAKVQVLVNNRCDLGEALVSTQNAGSFRHAFRIAYGKTNKHLVTTATVVPTHALGWFPQLAADCGLASKDAEVSVTPNCTHQSSHASAAAFDEFKKNDSNKCNKATNGAWSRFGAVAITAVLAAFAF